MYGLVNLAVQELICTQFGAEKWQQVCEIAGTLGVSFNRMQAYPDAITYKLVEGVSKALGITADEALCAFGEFWVLYTGRQGYGHLFQIAGSSLLDFLHNLDNLHSRVGQNFTELSPPSFQCEDLDAKSVLLHYHSDRTGLCPMVRGLLTGLGKYFHTEITIEHPSCIRDGAAHCEFLVKLV
jgi:predicted hydrocarbon binding protein